MSEENNRIALICASNQNRSMEAHYFLMNKGIPNVRSFGTGRTCKLPGPSQDKPNIYPFGTSYQKIFEELKTQNVDLYKSNGVLKMLERNAKVKDAPERWQDEKKQHFDVIITFEDRVFDAVCEDLRTREKEGFQMVHVFNINTKDNHEEATVGANQAYQLITMLSNTKEWRERLDCTTTYLWIISLDS
eukprot:TRINITY_DN8398_c1_g1_i2.p1 TRINITY_DN8398_c1_g1~~TRINITY_DN8398_c1_g1_i2.p1  ORF type:complete len:189 (-),score=60.01 TRINITY_DN8398_c1_g1_i2:78-644(-)